MACIVPKNHHSHGLYGQTFEEVQQNTEFMRSVSLLHLGSSPLAISPSLSPEVTRMVERSQVKEKELALMLALCYIIKERVALGILLDISN